MASPAPQRKLYVIALALTTLIVSVGSEKAVADPAENVSFDQQIAPLLASRCLSCHNSIEKKGGLDLQRETSASVGGDIGSVITAGKDDKSLLWERIVSDEMPPKQHLSAQEKEIVRQWIAEGAHWGTDPIDPFGSSTVDRAGYDWWSLQPIVQPDLPWVENTDWAQNEIDRFVLSKLEAAQRIAIYASGD